MNTLKKLNYLSSLLIGIVLLSSCGSDGDDGAPIPTDDNPSTGLLRANLEVSPASIEEGNDATITLTLDGTNTTGGNLVFDFEFGGTAEPGTDILSLVSTELVVADGEDEVTLQIESIDDDIMEDTETFTLELTSFPSGATGGTTTSITLMITDND